MSQQDIDNHKRFLAVISSGLPMPPDLADIYLRAYQRHIDEGLPLCVCLGIRGAGIRTEKTRELIKRRDVLLNAMVGSWPLRFNLVAALLHCERYAPALSPVPQ